MKGRAPIPALTAYDFPMTKLLDEAEIPIVLIGDSLGMVVLGFKDTTSVTIEMMEHHIAAAARAQPRALLVGDLPYRTYDTPADAVKNARRLMAAGAEAVKAEGGLEIIQQVRAIRAEGIAFMGHLGMLPQSVQEEGGYHIKGKLGIERDRLVQEAKLLAEAGAFAIVLELVSPATAKAITAAVPIPTIGIGSGPDCDGQILVTYDLLGMFPWFTPRFVKPKLNVAEQIRTVVMGWKDSLVIPAAK